VTGPPNANLRAAPGPPLPGPPNGDFLAGLAGWTAFGLEAPPLTPLPTGGVALSLRFDTTVVSPPFQVPPGAQALSVTARSIGLGATLEVRARPEEGGADIPLGTLEPPAVLTPMRVSLAGLAGRVIRVVLDPVPAIGRSVDVSAVGPVETPLSGWGVLTGVPSIVAASPSRELRVTDDPLSIASTPFAPGPAAVALLIAFRGEGTVRADAGSGPVEVRASGPPRDVRVPVAPGVVPVTLAVEARPGRAGLRLTDVGLVVRRTVMLDLRAGRAGRRVLITGRLAPAGGGLRVELRTLAGRRLGAAGTDASGGFRLATAARVRRVLVRTSGDRTRLAAGRRLRLPPPRRPPPRAR
jgi:hypothetical protein